LSELVTFDRENYDIGLFKASESIDSEYIGIGIFFELERDFWVFSRKMGGYGDDVAIFTTRIHPEISDP